MNDFDGLATGLMGGATPLPTSTSILMALKVKGYFNNRYFSTGVLVPFSIGVDFDGTCDNLETIDQSHFRVFQH